MKKITITGNVTKDAEVKDVNGRKAINFNVAVNESYKDRDGVKHEKATFFSCAIWRESNQSTELSRYLLKGTKVYVEGIPSAEIYRTKDNGHAIDFRIVVKEVELLSTKPKDEAGQNAAGSDLPGSVTTADGVPVDNELGF